MLMEEFACCGWSGLSGALFEFRRQYSNICEFRSVTFDRLSQILLTVIHRCRNALFALSLLACYEQICTQGQCTLSGWPTVCPQQLHVLRSWYISNRPDSIHSPHWQTWWTHFESWSSVRPTANAIAPATGPTRHFTVKLVVVFWGLFTSSRDRQW